MTPFPLSLDAFHSRSARSIPTRSLILAVALISMVMSRAATVTWDGGGGDGNWQTAANWSGNTLPGTADDVVISVPAASNIVVQTGTIRIRSLQCSGGLIFTGGDLTVTTGSSSIQGSLQLTSGRLAVQGASATLTATGATTHGGLALAALSGGRMNLPNLTLVTRTNAGHISFTADGAGSLLDLSSLTSASVADYYLLQLDATAGGEVRVPALTTVAGAIGAYADGSGSVVTLTGLSGPLLNTSPGGASLEARNGGLVQVPNVTSMDRLNVFVRGTGLIPLAQLTSFQNGSLLLTGNTNSWPGLTNVAGSDITLSGGAQLTLAGVTRLDKTNAGSLTFTVNDPGTALNLPNVTTAAVADYYLLALLTYTGGRISLPQLANVSGAIEAFADGTGSLVDLPAFQGTLRNSGPGQAYLEARSGGTVQVPNVQALEKINLIIRGTGQVTVSQLTRIADAEITLDGATRTLPGLTNVAGSDLTCQNGGRLYLPGVTMLVRTNTGSINLFASGTGSQLSLQNVTSASVPDYYQLILDARSGGQILLGQLSTIDGALNAFSDGAGSLVSLPGLEGTFGNPGPGSAYIEARNGGAIDMPNVTALNRITVTLRGASTLPLSQLTAITSGELLLDSAIKSLPSLTNIRGTDITTRNGAQLTLGGVTQLIKTNAGALTLTAATSSTLDLPNLTSAVVADFYTLSLNATDGSRLLVPRLSEIDGALGAYADDAGSLVDLSGLHGALTNSAPGAAFLEARNGATILMPNVTSLDRFNLTIRGTGQIPTTQLSAITRSTVLIDGTDATFGGLADTTGTSFSYLNGGTAQFLPPSDLLVTLIQAPATAVANQPVNIVWEITNVGTGFTNAAWSDGLALSSDQTPGGDIQIGWVPVSATLPSGSSLRLTNSVIFPAEKAGTWYLVVAANQSRTVWEGNNTLNNTNISSTPIQIQAPDLIVETLSVQPGGTQFGQLVNVSWSVRNTGTASASGPWNEGIYLARTPGSLVGAILLSNAPVTGVLQAGQSQNRSAAVTIPLASGWSAGTYGVIVSADTANKVPEGVETNNLREASLALTLPPLPDLSVGQLQSPSAAAPGTSISLIWTVTNGGPAIARSGWTESITIARTNAGAPQLPLLLLAATNDLSAGAIVTRTQTVLLPDELTAGVYQVRVDLDSEDLLLETSEVNNSRVSSTLLTVPSVLRLQLPLAEVSENIATPALTALVSRNGDTSIALTASLSSSLPGEVTVPASVNFPIGISSIPFTATVQRDNVPDPDRQVTITATASGYVAGSGSITVRNSDPPHLGFQPPALTVTEGLSSPLTLTRDGPTNASATIRLVASGTGQLIVPESVIIPAGQTSLTFAVIAVDDTRVEPTLQTTLAASGAGFTYASVVVSIPDNDLSGLTLTSARTTFSEGAGDAAALVTVSRGVSSPRSLDVAIENSNPGIISAPARVQIPAGREAVSFPIAALNNSLVDGSRMATLQAFAEATVSGVRVAQTAPLTFTVTDDDGPALSVAVSRDVLAEGVATAAILTVSRNTSTNQPLLVTLTSSDTSEATVPPALTIPAGQVSATASVTTLNDNIDDGNQQVQLTASAAGYTSGTAVVTVTDINRPDLIVTDATGPDSAETEAFVNVSYRVVNQGLAAAGTNWVTRLSLSKDPAPGDDQLLTDYAFNGTLPPGQFFGQTRQVRLPLQPGDYWLVAVTDLSSQIEEIREDNNVAVSAKPIHVLPAYQATVQADLQTAPAGTVVPLHGTATRTQTGGPVPFVLVNIHLRVRETERIFSALTDDAGNFSVNFTPLPGEAGLYEIGASHPGVTNAPTQDSFTLIGMKAGEIQPLKLADRSSLTGQLPILNLGDLPLTGVSVTVVSNSPNLQVTASLAGDGTLPGLATASLGYAIAALDPSIPDATVVLRVSSTEGATLDVVLPVNVISLVPRLATRPGELIAGMKPGGQAFVEFDVINEGGASSGPVQIVLPDFPWMHVVSASPLPSIAPGSTNHVVLQLTPPAGLALGPYTGTLALNNGTSGWTVPFQFRALSEAKGDLRVTAVDEYTYYAEGAPKVAGASVTVRDAVSEQVVTNGVTDTAGQLLIPQIPEGYYEVQITADQHKNYRGISLVVAGFETNVTAFISRQAVRYVWTVTPTEIEDRTRISVETVFESYVPIPVITVDPPLIDLADYTADVTQIDLTIANHGLISAKEAALSFGTHPDWSFEPLISDLGDIPARSSLTIPLLIRRLDIAHAGVSKSGRIAKHAGGGGCSVSGACRFIVECGGAKIGGGAPVIIVNAKGNCGGGGGGGGISGGGPGNPGGGGGGAGPGDSSASIRSCDECMPAVLNCIIDFTIPDYVDCSKDIASCVSSGGNAWECTKAALTCAEFAGQEALQGVNKAIDAKECLEGLQAGCASIPSGGGGSISGSPGAFRSVPGRIRKMGPDSSRIERGEFTYVRQRMDAVMDVVAPIRFLFGNDAWFGPQTPESATNWLHHVLQFIEPTTDGGTQISAAESAQLLALPRPSSVTPSIAQAFIDRWNRSVSYWGRGILNQSDVPAGENPDFIAYGTLKQLAREAVEADAAAAADGFASTADALRQSGVELFKFLGEGEGGGVCAHVRIRLDQDLVSTRDAFNATLEIENSLAEPVDQLFVDVTVRRRNGQDVTHLFAHDLPVLAGITAVDGTGTIASNATASVKWLLVPTTDAVLDAPEEFLVSGVLRYHQGGLNLNVPLAPATITVFPSPSLAVKYFHQRDVFADDPFTVEIEPSIPFSLAVMVENKGYGAARNVQIRSAQPKIVENEKGLLVDFKIIATEVAGQNLQPSLTVDFGNIAPHTNAIGRWLLTSTLLGGFIEYSATIEHRDGLDREKLSLVEGVEIHELIHIVRALGSRDDGRPDFLVNDLADIYDRPDRVHLSDGTVEPVSVVLSGTVDAAPTTNDLQVNLTAKFPPGWVYLRIPDPGTNRFRLTRVVRSDGREIPVGENAWTTDRTFLGNARRPLRENMLHLFDDNSGGQYTLYYAVPPQQDLTPPASQVDPLPSDSSALIPVSWSGQDNTGGSGISFFDIFVSIDNAPFILWQMETLDRSAVYQGALGHTYSFYSVATDVAGNQEAIPLTADAHTTVTRINHPPLLNPLADRVVREGELLVINPVASDPDGDSLVFSLSTNAPPGMVVNPYSGLITWPTGEGSGQTSTLLTLQVLDTGSPRLGAVRSFTVTVTDENSPPILTPVGDRTIAEGRLLLVTNRAQDFDLPSQTLTFKLGPGAPANASLDTVTGVFSWQPDNTQGGTTNRITIVVSDDGTPSLSATQTFAVVVLDTRSDFLTGFGTTNLLAGQAGVVPVFLNSGADLTEFTFEFEASDVHLTDLVLTPAASGIISAALDPLGNDRYRITMDLDPAQSQSGLRTVGYLNFNTQVTGTSSIAELRPTQLLGIRLDGTPLRNATAQNGRVFLIEDEPLIDGTRLPNGTVRLTAYAQSGTFVRLLYSPALGGQASWQELQNATVTGTFHTFDWTSTNPPTAFFLIRRN